LNGVIKNPNPESDKGYPWHEYIMALQYLIDSGQVKEEIVKLAEIKDQRPAHTFVFLCLEDNPNEEWNTREVNKWIANWNGKK